jgi:hypothetical protein
VRRAGAVIRVGPNVHVSRDLATTSHYELLAGAHARDPNRRMACSMAINKAKNKSTSVVYTTIDGGKTWKLTLDSDEGTLTGDPVCAYGPGDTAYFVVLALRDTAKMLVYRSTDAGISWGKPYALPFIDRENLVVDQIGGKYNGHVYINGTGSAAGIDGGSTSTVALFRSLDGGRTFDGPIMRPAIAPQHVFGMANTVVLSDGSTATLFGMWKDRTERSPDGTTASVLRVLRTADGGESWGDMNVVDQWTLGGSSGRWLAVDPGSPDFKDRLYAVWDDVRSGGHQILFSHSADKGKTWSKALVVSDVRQNPDPKTGPDPMMPLVEVNKNGVVGVVWYDRREHKDNIGWDLRFAASLGPLRSRSPAVSTGSFIRRDTRAASSSMPPAPFTRSGTTTGPACRNCGRRPSWSMARRPSTAAATSPRSPT